MQESFIWLRGTVADPPQWDEESSETTFVLASTIRVKVDGPRRRVVETAHAWCEIVCDAATALNVPRSLARGDPVTVVGFLRPVVIEDHEGGPLVLMAVRAAAVGHDLAGGVTRIVPEPA